MGKADNHKEFILFFRAPREIREEIKRMATKEHRKQGNMTTVLILEALKARKNVRSSN